MGKKKTSILEFVPKGWTLRKEQEYALLEMEKNWDRADVIVAELPVGSGKSLISFVLSRWLAAKHMGSLKTRILAPTNILVRQYANSMTGLHSLEGMDNYECATMTQPDYIMSCKDVKREVGHTCQGCPYMQRLRKAHAYPYGVYNYWVYLAHKLFGDVLVLDEAHKAIDLIKELNAKKIWKHDVGYPNWVKTYGQLRKWLEGNPDLETSKKLQLLYEELCSGATTFLVQRTEDVYRGEMRDVIKLVPVDVRNSPPFLWPNKVKKVVFLSATFGRKDIENLGLDRRRVLQIATGSPIPVDRRPVFLDTRWSMSYAEQDRNLPMVVRYIKDVLKRNPDRGFIHAPYSLAEKLSKLLRGEPRILFHDKDNKEDKLEEFKEKEGAVLIASGMYEGVSLDEDLGRWQIVVKIPWPSLAEPAIKWLSDRDPEWYANETIRTLEQASGRICRGPSDYGETIIIDSSFRRLYANHGELFHRWFTEACMEGAPPWLISKRT